MIFAHQLTCSAGPQKVWPGCCSTLSSSLLVPYHVSARRCSDSSHIPQPRAPSHPSHFTLPSPQESDALKHVIGRGLKPGTALLCAFENCCNATGVLLSLKRAMVAYTSSKTNTVRFKAGIITDSNPALVDTLRLASIMVDPRCVQLFGRMANPTQDRLALDFPELRIQAVKQQLLEILAKDFFNNVNFSPSSQPDIQCWSDGADFDVSVPQEQRSWMWLTQKMQYIKQGMTTLLANFSKSGSIYTHALYAASHAASHHIMCLLPNQETLKMAWMTPNVTCSSGKSFATGRQNGFGFTCVGSVGEKYLHGALLFFPTNGAWMLGLKMNKTEPMRCELCYNFIVCDASYVRSCNQV